MNKPSKAQWIEKVNGLIAKSRTLKKVFNGLAQALREEGVSLKDVGLSAPELDKVVETIELFRGCLAKSFLKDSRGDEDPEVLARLKLLDTIEEEVVDLVKEVNQKIVSLGKEVNQKK
jgi:hypothetical protein